MDEQKKWKIGQTSTKYETGNRGVGTISTGKDDRGGVSYGVYQLASKTGTVKEYLDQSRFKADFEGLQPGSKEFAVKWMELATGTDSESFSSDQHDFIKRTHYEVQVRRLKIAGVDLSDRGPAVQDALWSTAVQYRNGTRSVFEMGLKDRFGKEYELAKLSDKDIVEAIQDYKYKTVEKYFKGFPRQQETQRLRSASEKEDLIFLADNGFVAGIPPALGKKQAASPNRIEVSVIKYGTSGGEVAQLQDQLRDLGYTNTRGAAIVSDGIFGADTESAVINFQRDHHLNPDGIAGPKTRKALQEDIQSLAPATPDSYAWRYPPRLDDPNHPDNNFYIRTRDLVYQLDAKHGREPDQRSDNLASALTVAARESGLERIDQIALNKDASALWGVQRPPGMKDHFFDLRCKVDTLEAVNTSMEQSGAQWDQAMQRLGRDRGQQPERSWAQSPRASVQQASQPQAHHSLANEPLASEPRLQQQPAPSRHM